MTTTIAHDARPPAAQRPRNKAERHIAKANSQSNSEVLDTMPPVDEEAEQGLVASLLLNPNIIDTLGESVQASDFYAGHLGLVWHEARGLRHDGFVVDATLLIGRLKEKHSAVVSSWEADIGELYSTRPTAAHAEHYARRVVELSRRRRLQRDLLEGYRQLADGASAGTVQRHVSQCLEDIARRQCQFDFAPMTLPQLMAADVTVEYLIPGVLAAKQPILWAGPVKSLKTSLLCDLAFALETGGAFLGYFRVAYPINVGLVTGESGLPTIKETFGRIANAAGIDPAAAAGLIVSDRIPRLSNPAHLEAIRHLILDYGLELLAIDPAYLALDGADAANVMLFGQQLREVSQLCQDNGVALLLCHHTKKGSGIDYQPLGLTDAAWSGFAEHARQWLLVNHRERYDHERGVHRLWLSVGGSAGHGGLYAVDVEQGRYDDPGGRRWVATVSTSSDAEQQLDDRKAEKAAERSRAAVERHAKKICTALAKMPDGATKRSIRDFTGLKQPQVDAAIAMLLEDQSIVPTTVTVSNHKRPHEGFRLADTEA